MNARELTRALPPVLSRLIPRLASNFDGEILATVAAIRRTLESENLDLHDLARAVVTPAQEAPTTQWDYEPRRTESDEARQMRAWLEAISREDWINEWTAGFISSLLRRRSLNKLSECQLDCVDRIISEAFDRGARADRSAA